MAIHHSQLATLRRFGRAVTQVGSASEIYLLLTEFALVGVGAEASEVVVPDGSGTLVRASSRALSTRSRVDLAPELGAEVLPKQTRIVGGDGVLYGVLMVSGAVSRRWTSDDDDFLAALADRAAVAMERLTSLERLQQSKTELGAARTALERVHRLALLGETAAGIVHDIRNLFGPLSLHLQFLRRHLHAADGSTYEAIDDMQDIIRSGVDTTERLRMFSKNDVAAPSVPADANEISRQALAVGRPHIHSRRSAIRLEERLDATALIDVPSSEAVAVVTNLVVNAIDAVHDGGTVRVSTSSDQQTTRISVADDGVGMSPEVKRRIFEPFFTTKGDNGTGLGLSMAYAFAKRHNAELRVDTHVGRGTTMTLVFPHAQARS